MITNKQKSFILSFIIFFLYALIFFQNIAIAIILSMIISLKSKDIFANLFERRSLRYRSLMFRDFLDIINSSIISGYNFQVALAKTNLDIKGLYNDEDLICRCTDQLLNDIESGLYIDQALEKFSNRLDLEEAKIFSQTLFLSINSGMDTQKIIENSKDSITDQINTQLEIDSAIDSSKRELIIMIILPLVILTLLTLTNLSRPSFGEYIIRFIVFIIIIFSFYIGNKIVDLEV